MTLIHAPATLAVNEQVARDTWRLRLVIPDLAAAIRPGQFVMLRARGTSDPLLGRPYAVYDVVLDDHDLPRGLDVVYLVVGKQTSLLTTYKPGDVLDVWGPLGNGFPVLDGVGHVGLVAGGIGQTPFLAHIRDLLGTRSFGGRFPRPQCQKVTLYYGVRTAELAAGVDDFRAAGAEVKLASDDGSVGYRGYVTQLLERDGPPDHLFGCGPEPMLKALAALARRWNVPCHLSLETPMACGVGICFSCVTPVQTPEGWDYKRVCVEGPVFEASSLRWES